jgi:hypothetical protein
LNQNQPIVRCSWCGNDPLYVRYHDEEWGKPVYDDQTLFEFLILESAQAGLSWITGRHSQILMLKKLPTLARKMLKDYYRMRESFETD